MKRSHLLKDFENPVLRADEECVRLTHWENTTHRWRAVLRDIRWRRENRNRELRNRDLKGYRVAIVGYPIPVNAGDRWMVETAHAMLQTDSPVDFLDFREAHSWPAKEFELVLIACGAGLGLGELKALRMLNGNAFWFLGVEFPFDPHRVEADDLAFLRKCRCWVRTERALHKARVMNLSTTLTSDITLSCSSPFKQAQTLTPSRHPVIGMNIANLFLRKHSRSFIPEAVHISESGDRLSSQRIAHGYLCFIRYLVEEFIKKGYSVFHIPFAEIDETLAGAVFRDLPVDHLPYTGIRPEALPRMDIFFPTRFHALVAGLHTNLPLVPIPYMPKNTELLKTIGMNSMNVQEFWKGLEEDARGMAKQFAEETPMRAQAYPGYSSSCRKVCEWVTEMRTEIGNLL